MAKPTLGDVIRRQRELHRLSLREMARLSGISNPYLSQIERGLREPSVDVVEGIASALDVTTQALFEAAGVASGEEDAEDPAGVEAAIEGDPALRPAQRRALIETLRAFVIANGGPRPRPKPRSR